MTQQAARWFWVIGLALIAGCSDFPTRDNPNDPKSPLYHPPTQEVPFRGSVTSQRLAGEALPDSIYVIAEVIWPGAGDYVGVWATHPSFDTCVSLHRMPTALDTFRITVSCPVADLFHDPQVCPFISDSFSFVGCDGRGRLFSLGPLGVAQGRVFTKAPELSSPSNRSAGTRELILHWKPAQADFPFHYQVKVYSTSALDAGLSTTPVWDSQPLPIAADSVSLPADRGFVGEYTWAVFAVDEFGDLARSSFWQFSIVPTP